MKVITFCGDCTHINELDYDFVIVDRTYFHDLPDDAHDIIWNVSESDDRQTRIALNLLKALSFAKHLPDNVFAIIDSDVIMPNLRRAEGYPMLRDRILTPCFPVFYDWAGEVRPFCNGTNYIFTRDKTEIIENAVNGWLGADPEKRGKIDLYIHDHIPYADVFIPPVSHYVRKDLGGQKVTYYYTDYNIILRHIPELVYLIT